MKMDHKALFVSDLHGNRHAYDKLFEIALQNSIDNIIIGGDLTPKKIAVKLKDAEKYPEDGEYNSEVKPEFIEGPVIPLELLEADSDRGTYTESLKKIKRLNDTIGTKTLLLGLERGGYIIHNVDSGFFSFQQMLDEQITTDRLIDFLKNNYGPNRHNAPFPLDNDQIWLIESIAESLEGIEKEWPATRKQTLADGWNRELHSPEIRKNGRQPTYGFWKLAMSRNLVNYFKFRDKLPEIREQHKQLKAALACDDEEIKGFFEKRINEALEDILLARDMIAAYKYDDKEYKDGLKRLGIAASAGMLADLTHDWKIYITGQKEFVNGYLRQKLVELKKSNPSAKVYAVLGNDDMTEVTEDLRKLHEEGLVTYLENDVAELRNGLFIAGYPYLGESTMFYNGWGKEADQMREDFGILATKSDPRRTIYVCHAPPFGGALDVAYDGKHIGNEALAEFIEKHRPRAVLSGHAHEAFKRSGKVMEKRGQTTCFNAGGDHGEKKLRAVIVDLDNPENYERVDEK